MRGYLAVIRCRIAALLQYRSAAFAGSLNQLFWGGIRTMIFVALYSQSSVPQPISLAAAITFIWLGQTAVTLLPWDVDEESEESIRSGNVVYTLTQPLDLFWIFFSRSFALRLIPTLMRSLPIFIAAGLFFGLPSPASWGAGSAFVCSMILATILSSALTTMVVTTLFWTMSGEGIQRILPHLSLLFSGLVVPLPLFPDWMQPFLNAQPLRGIVDIPSRIYTGIIAMSDVPFYLGFQLAWSLVAIVIGRVLMGRALKRIEIQGG